MPNLSSTVQRRWIFLAFLGVLHLVFLQDPASQLGRLLFLSHIGLGLLWQPFVQPRRRVGFGGVALVVCSAALLAYNLNWELLLLWSMLLAGVAGGKVFLFPDRWERVFHLFALGYLATVVLALILPRLLASLQLSQPALPEILLFVPALVLPVMAVLPQGQAVVEDRAEIVDYIYGVLVFLLLAVIVLGSLSFALVFKAGYFESLLMTLALVSGVLLMLGLIWDPRAGFIGLGTALVQHVTSLGLPLDAWLASLAEISRREEDPERFLSLACAELPQRLPGVIGVAWEDWEGNHLSGRQDGHPLSLEAGALRLVLVTRGRPSPVQRWHYDLVARLLAEFAAGKWRAMELKRLSYIEAIHETGARLTHDVKNLLQSLDTLCEAAELEGDNPSVRFSQLVRRQLPEVSARLRQTLVKLSAPAVATSPTQSMPVAAWLESLGNRYPGSWLSISAEGDAAACQLEDAVLFSSTAENLLQNIAEKRRTHPEVLAQVRLICGSGGPWLEVCDTGDAIPEARAARLFSQPLPSETGLGIGLYQSARQADQACYRLTLEENRAGRVCFRLRAAK